MARWLKWIPHVILILQGLLMTVVFADDRADHVDGEMIVKFKSGIERTEEDILKIFSEQIRFHQYGNKLESENDVDIIKKYAWANIYHLRAKYNDELDRKLDELRALPEIEYAEPNYLLGLDVALDAIDYSAAAVKEKKEKEKKKKGNPLSDCDDVVVAVIDTGVDYSHADLKAHIWGNSGEIPNNNIDDDQNGFVDDVRGWDFVNDDNDPYDDHYHGTHVSGIVLSMQDAANPMMKIMPLKFLASSGFGSTGDAIQAIDYAVKNGAKVLNNSWGGGGFSKALRDVIISSYYANKVFIAAAGNSAVNIDNKPSYPASFLVPHMINVAALNSTDSLAWFSNWGANSVHVGAPGVSIRSSVPKEMCQDPPCYSYLSGTSMATPYVSGLSAMIKCENPDLMHLQVKSIIMETAVSNASLEGKIGKGSIAQEEALFLASNTQPDMGDIPEYTPTGIPSSIGVIADGGSGDTVSAGLGCGVITDIMNGSNDHFNSGSGMALFLLTWPLIFAMMLKILLLRRRKFVFHQL